MTTGTIHLPSRFTMQSVDPHLEQSFYRRFPKTRESYDSGKERETLVTLSGSTDWKRIGRPSFRRDALTGIVLRKAQPSRLYPMGRVTACVPYELSFNVAVSQRLCISRLYIPYVTEQAQALEHVEEHALLSRGKKPDSIDSKIAAKYTGVNRDQLRYIRDQCFHCYANAGMSSQISVDCPLVVRNIVMTVRALNVESHPSTKIKDTSSGGERGHTSGSGTASVGQSSNIRYSTLFWIGCEDKMTEQLSTQVMQHRHTTAVNSAHVPSCFMLDRAADLLHLSGPAFLSIGGEHVTAHQSLAVASILEDSARCQVRYQTARWLQRHLMNRSSPLDPQTMLMLAWRRYDSNAAAAVQEIYSHVKRYESRVLRVFPSKEELEHAHGKIGDIWALDEVAQGATSGWSFRPTTCDCTSACRLEKVGVLKRTHSCGSEHVIVRPTASDVSRHLRCTAGQRRMSKRRIAQGAERWFHQEFVEGLRQIGEFRVFIVTVNDVTATRGRRGEVVEMVHTVELEDRELVVTVLSSTSTWSGKPNTYGEVDLDELKRFALYVFNALRNRPDWSTNFESLEIGARIDVGITTVDESCRYFVNEVTRIYEADFFAEWLARPGTHICRTVSTALQEVFLVSSNE